MTVASTVTKAMRWVAATRVYGPEPVARGVWRVRGNPGRLNVYLLADPSGGITVYDAGGAFMASKLRDVIDSLGPLSCVVLGHAHTDHRGAAPLLGAPVICHPEEVVDAEGSGGLRYWGVGLPKLPLVRRGLHRALLQPLYDAGPVAVTRTVADGDDVAGFRVVHLPGHAPGLIALVRDEDGLALTSDAFYTVDEWWRDSSPYLPGAAWTWDIERAAASLLDLAALEPRSAWPGHGEPLRGEVAQLLRNAAAVPPR